MDGNTCEEPPWTVAVWISAFVVFKSKKCVVWEKLCRTFQECFWLLLLLPHLSCFCSTGRNQASAPLSTWYSYLRVCELYPWHCCSWGRHQRTSHSHLQGRERRDNVHRGYGFPARTQATVRWTDRHSQKESIRITHASAHTHSTYICKDH